MLFDHSLADGLTAQQTLAIACFSHILNPPPLISGIEFLRTRHHLNFQRFQVNKAEDPLFAFFQV
jgi:hypothetical protein